jgi:hypothetical protein
VVGYSIHQQADDTRCFIPHMQKQKFPQGKLFKNGSGDAGYGSEENYAYLEKLGMGNYFPYDQEKDEFSCPAQNRMVYIETKPINRKTISCPNAGYLSV